MSQRRTQVASSEISPIQEPENPERTFDTNPSPSSPAKLNTDVGDNGEDGHVSLWRKLVNKFGSVTLDNKGSTARDHLALERTFLAWLRTSVAFASIGIAITQLFRLNTTIASPPSNSGSVSTLLDQLREQIIPGGGSVQDSQTSAADPDALQRLRHVGTPLGAAFLATAILVLLVGFHRYFESQYWVTQGKFPASRASVALIGLVALALIVTSLVVILVMEPTSFQKK